MKTVGLLGGMSWESPAEHSRLLNEAAKAELGEKDSTVPVFNTTKTRAQAAVKWALTP